MAFVVDGLSTVAGSLMGTSPISTCASSCLDSGATHSPDHADDPDNELCVDVGFGHEGAVPAALASHL